MQKSYASGRVSNPLFIDKVSRFHYRVLCGYNDEEIRQVSLEDDEVFQVLIPEYMKIQADLIASAVSKAFVGGK